jgi:hypothetical protein
MSTPYYIIQGIDMDMDVPEDTPEYGGGEVVMLYITINKDGRPHYCCYLFEPTKRCLLMSSKSFNSRIRLTKQTDEALLLGLANPSLPFGATS